MIRALDEYLYEDEDSYHNNQQKDVRTIVVPSHTLRMLINIQEPTHMKMLRDGAQQHNRSLRNVR